MGLSRRLLLTLRPYSSCEIGWPSNYYFSRCLDFTIVNSLCCQQPRGTGSIVTTLVDVTRQSQAAEPGPKACQGSKDPITLLTRGPCPVRGEWEWPVPSTLSSEPRGCTERPFGRLIHKLKLPVLEDSYKCTTTLEGYMYCLP